VGDGSKPRAELALSPKPIQRDVDACPNVLEDILGVGGVEGHVKDVNEQPVGVFGDEAFECEGVTGFDAIDQQGVFASAGAGIGLGGRDRHVWQANTVACGRAKVFACRRVFRCG